MEPPDLCDLVTGCADRYFGLEDLEQRVTEHLIDAVARASVVNWFSLSP